METENVAQFSLSGAKTELQTKQRKSQGAQGHGGHRVSDGGDLSQGSAAKFLVLPCEGQLR